MTFRILHISDIHFGPPHLSGRLFSLNEMVEKADVVIVSGDLSQRAKSKQLLAARNHLTRMGTPFVAVPGNHDVPLYPAHLRVFAPFYRWKKNVQKDVNTRFHIPGLAVHALNSAHGFTSTEGRVHTGHLDYFRRSILRTSPSDFQVLALHHPLLPIPGDSRDRTLRGAYRLLRRLAEYPVDLVLSGHLHRSIIQDVRDWHAQFPYALPVAHIGTGSTNRGRGKEKHLCSVQMISVNKNSFTLHPYLWRDSTFHPGVSLTHPRNHGPIDHSAR